MSLRAAIARIARVPQLLVACDYDGTLAPLVDDPAYAVPLPEAAAAIRAARRRCRRPRSRSSPGGRCATWPRCRGCPARSTSSAATARSSTSASSSASQPEVAELRTRLGQAVSELARDHPGVRLEQKPASVAVHTRGAEPRRRRERCSRQVRSGPAAWPGVHVTTGKDVIELSVVATDKGTAVDELRTQHSASAVIFLGDDATDETAFAKLQGPDIGIKIGHGRRDQRPLRGRRPRRRRTRCSRC